MMRTALLMRPGRSSRSRLCAAGTGAGPGRTQCAATADRRDHDGHRRRAVRTHADAAGLRARVSDQPGPQSKGHKLATLSYRKIQDLEFDPLFLRYMQRPLFKHICERAYGLGTPVSSYRAMFMNKPAHEGTDLAWHQDRWTSLDRDPLITIWTALDPAREDNGCMWVTPGRHNKLINPSDGSGFLPPNRRKPCGGIRSRTLDLGGGGGPAPPQPPAAPFGRQQHRHCPSGLQRLLHGCWHCFHRKQGLCGVVWGRCHEPGQPVGRFVLGWTVYTVQPRSGSESSSGTGQEETWPGGDFTFARDCRSRGCNGCCRNHRCAQRVTTSIPLPLEVAHISCRH